MKEVSYEERMKSIKGGLALGLGFLVVATYLMFTPEYFGNDTITRVVSIIIFLLGIIGLSLELNKLVGEHKKIGFDDFGLGLTLVIIWAILHYYFPQTWVNIILFFLLLLAVYGMLLGFINIIHSIIIDTSSIRKKTVKALVVLAQIVAFIGALLQSMQILKLIS